VKGINTQERDKLPIEVHDSQIRHVTQIVDNPKETENEYIAAAELPSPEGGRRGRRQFCDGAKGRSPAETEK
jgi:hypothetical protein